MILSCKLGSLGLLHFAFGPKQSYNTVVFLFCTMCKCYISEFNLRGYVQTSIGFFKQRAHWNEIIVQ